MTLPQVSDARPDAATTDDRADRAQEAAWRTYTQVNEWVRFSDAKATALLAVSGVLGGLLVSVGPPGGDDAVAVVRLVLFVFALGAVVLSALISLQAMLPRLSACEDPTSLIYFDHVARRYPRDADRYIDAFARLTADAAAMTHEINAQIWANSAVARRKFRRVTRATWLIGVAMLCAAVTALLSDM